MNAALVLVAATLVGEPAQPPPALPVPKPAAAPPKDVPDPTKPGPKLGEVLNPPKLDVRPGGPAAEALPSVQLRGRVIAGARATAILEVDKQMYSVGVGGQVRTMTVLEITPAGVKVEVDLGAKKVVLVLN